jgi:uncharacterized DUF497 family protein
VYLESVGPGTLDTRLREYDNDLGITDARHYGEERVNLLGMCGGALLHVTYTERGERIWMISARRAERHEQDHDFRENSG